MHFFGTNDTEPNTFAAQTNSPSCALIPLKTNRRVNDNNDNDPRLQLHAADAL